MAGNVPLKFYHFTGYDSGAGKSMLQKYAAEQPAAQILWHEYAAEILREGQQDADQCQWSLLTFDNGVPIPNDARRIYRNRIDLQNTFPNPYCAYQEPSFYSWWLVECASSKNHKSLGFLNFFKLRFARLLLNFHI
jgi:hypothetical protein